MLWMKGGGESAGGGLVSLSLALSLCNPRTHVLKLIFPPVQLGASGSSAT